MGPGIDARPQFHLPPIRKATTMNVALIREAIEAIRSNPRNVDLTCGFQTPDDRHTDAFNLSELGLLDGKNYSGGIAAWLLFACGGRVEDAEPIDGQPLEQEAARVAGLTDDEARWLFGTPKTSERSDATEAAHRLERLLAKHARRSPAF